MYMYMWGTSTICCLLVILTFETLNLLVGACRKLTLKWPRPKLDIGTVWKPSTSELLAANTCIYFVVNKLDIHCLNPVSIMTSASVAERLEV